jgi:hypothetical protein
MTTLVKPKTFRLRLAGQPPELVVLLDPSGYISFREPRKRTWFALPLARVYHLAAMAAADEIRAARKTRRSKP